MSYHKQKDRVVQEAKKYIALMNHIIRELEDSGGIMNQERKAVLQKKVVKYKAKIESLKEIHATRN